jgi:ribosomal protein S27AE
MLSKEYDQYQIENQFEISPFHDQNLLNDGNMIYYSVNVNYTPEGSEETEYTEYLASLDLSARSPEWTLHEYNVSEIEEEYSSISRLAVNGRIYILVSTYGKDYSMLYSFDPDSNVLTKEAALPVFVHNAYMTEYNGSIYVMFLVEIFTYDSLILHIFLLLLYVYFTIKFTPLLASKLENDVCPNCGFYAGHESLGEEYEGSTTTTTHGYRDEFDHSSRSGNVITNYYNRIRETTITHEDHYVEDRCCARCGYNYEVHKTRIWKEKD